MLLRELNEARCGQPFEKLGWIYDNEQSLWRLRVWLPHATQVAVRRIEKKTIESQLTCVHVDGLFEAEFAKLASPFAYALSVNYGDTKTEVIDPYQFHDEAYRGLAEMKLSADNIYRTLGAQLIETEVNGVTVKGVKFAVYAPSAMSVSLLGDFNFWDGRRHPMQRSLCGHWVLFVPGLEAGARYKFELKDMHGHCLPHKADPVGFYADQYPSFASVVYDQKKYQWHDAEWQKSQRNDKLEQPLSIYEIHFGSWKRHDNGDSLSYREMADELIPYLQEMNYTHIELMPIMEHPFSGSWGYQPLGLFAPTSRYGSADDFKYFVDRCHEAGIGVILDWVPAHFPSDAHGLARFDGTPLYEYEDPRRGWHPDWNSYIYDFGRDTVRQFLIASALFWLDHFHIDGLRVDAVASMLYWDYSRDEGQWVPNLDGGNHNYEAISLLQWFNREVYERFPHAMTIAEESTAFSGVSRPTYTGGLGFTFKWNMGWMNDSLRYMAKEPVHRKFHHNDLTFSMVYHYNENFVLSLSHDEVVHGKQSLLYKMPGDEWQQAANLRTYMGYMYAHPGKKLNFMGTEIAQASEWDHDGQLDWWLLGFDKHRGQKNLIRDLNKLYRSESAMYDADYLQSGFEWLDHSDWENSALLMIRRNKAQDSFIIAACNFTPVPRDGFRMGVPEAGRYQIVLNTDSGEYWGGDYFVGADVFHTEAIASHGKDHSIVLNLPPLASVFIKKVVE
nr:1,4-alpha-glucan branching protein GlgB [uncultured Tolumonas sp.]